MSDLLLNLGANKAARSVLGSVGVPMPPTLRRATGPWSERPLSGRSIALRGSGGLDGLGDVLGGGGATVAAETDGVDGIVFDGTGLTTPSDLRQLHDAFHPLLPALRPNARVVVLGRHPSTAGSPVAAAAASALDGFTRSLAKELGRKGSTANLVHVDDVDRLEPVLLWLLSDHAAFVDGQPLRVSSTCAGEPEGWRTAPLTDRVVLVTGAARGIGEATARRLAAEGATVVALDRPGEDTLGPLAAELGGVALALDITDDDAPARIAAALAELGGAYAVVHNAGITRDKTLGRMDAARWDGLMDVNLGAIVRIQAALEEGPLLDGGRVVLLSSIAGLAGNPGQTNYAASKAAVAGLARALGPALGPRGIAVNAVAPGFIETRMTAAIPFATREAGRRLSNLNQGGLPSDVAEVVAFLASPFAVGLTGSVLRVCGGSLIGA